MEKEIDCFRTEEIVCPYCALIFSDSYEFDFRNETQKEIQCWRCERLFDAIPHFEVNYTSYKKEE